jgi:hypothetical protein
MCVFPIAYTSLVLSGNLAAAEMNEKLNFAGLRIYGLLTDLTQFKFYSYNPSTKQFSFDERIVIEITRSAAFTNMVNGLFISALQLLRSDMFFL